MAPRGKAPATADLIRQMVVLCPDNMIGKRDRALLAWALPVRSAASELFALQVEDLVEVPDGFGC